MSEQPYDPRARLIHVPSAAIGEPRPCYIYLPPEHHQAGRPLPTLYLLRGHEREWVNPHEDESRGGTTVIDVYERLRARGAVGPMILVMPGLASADNAVPSILTDMAEPERAAGKGIGLGAFRRFFFDELIPFVDSNYRTAPGARAVAGFSLGGLMAVLAAALHPERFISVGCFDGTILYAADGGRRARASDSVLANPMFDAALGVPRQPAQLDAISPITLLLRADRAALRRLTWLIQYGPEELEPWGSNFYRGEYLLRSLAALGIANSAPVAALPDGRHTWQVADRHIEQTLPLHWRAMCQAAGLAEAAS